MKQIFFRIIELPTHQVLLEKSFEPQRRGADKPTIKIAIYHETMRAGFTLGYGAGEEELRDKMFAEYTDAQAQELVINMIAMYGDAEQEAEHE